MASTYDRRSGSSGSSRNRKPQSKRPAPRGGKPPRRTGEDIARRKRIEREQRLARARLGSKLRVVLLVLLAAATVAGAVALYQSSFLTVARYRLVGASHLKLDHVLRVAKVPPGATLIRFPSGEVRKRIAADPWVESVKVRRKLPDTVEFEVVERTPVAMVETSGGLWLVDAGGWVIQQQAAETSAGAIVVRKVEGLKPKPASRLTSPVLANALGILTGVDAELRAMVRFVDAPSVDETALITKENVDILMGPAQDLDKKDRIARQILAEQRGKVVFIDVRSTDRPVSRGIDK